MKGDIARKFLSYLSVTVGLHLSAVFLIKAGGGSRRPSIREAEAESNI